MSQVTSERSPASEGFRDRCYGCFRPRAACFCDVIPRIANRTHVLILQHMRERFHPFNTARIVARALENSTLLVDRTPALNEKIELQPRAGLLYPGPHARLLSELSPQERPAQLVVLDGTWHQAKTLFRELTALRDLPRFQLAPPEPSRYRIRREPCDEFLSTIEATVSALRKLEPDTPGWDALLAAFNTMVEGQLAHPKSIFGRRMQQRRLRTSHNVPLGLAGDLANVVVAYGEYSAGERGQRRNNRDPIYWVAERLGDGARFACPIQSPYPFADDFLKLLELQRTDFVDAPSLAAARAAWAAFRRPLDTIAVYNHSTAKLFAKISPDRPQCLVLRAVDFNPQRRYSTLEQTLAGESLVPPPSVLPGRAGKRLMNAITLVRHLNSLANSRIDADFP